MYNVFEKLKTLPVASILDDISAHNATGGISIINCITGSGKSLLVPLRIQKDTQGVVIVVQPRRFLAINAAETLAELSETKLGEEFGYLIGHTGDEDNLYDRNKTKLAFMTYGFVLATRLLMEADHIVLDEIHEQSLDMNICRALLRHRYENGNPPKSLILMSASIDAEAEMSYWSNVAPVKIFSASEGRTFECKKIHLPATKPSAAALELIDQGKKGILLFAPGIGEIQDIIKELGELIRANERWANVIVQYIHGQSEYSERASALSPPPKDCPKILVGTNVIESGMNLPWVDAGVTTGEKKELHVRSGSGAVVLTKVPLVKFNADQQAGRTNRFCDSVFVICGEFSYEQLKKTSTSEIERLPLTSLYMHCQAIDIDPNDLHFMPQPSHEKMTEAATKLKNLGFFDEKLKFTDDGWFAQNLPVGLETAAMLCHAKKLNILADVIPLAAVFETSSLRKDQRNPHGFNFSSDILDGTMAYVKACDIQSRDLSRTERLEEMERINVSYKRYVDVGHIIKTLERLFSVSSNMELYSSKNVSDDERFAQLIECILAGSVCNMGVQYPSFRSNMFRPAGSVINSYQTSNSTSVRSVYDDTPAAAKLRTITPRSSRQAPFTIAENITLFSDDIIAEYSKTRPGVFTSEPSPIFKEDINFKVNGVIYYTKRVEPEVVEEDDEVFSIRPIHSIQKPPEKKNIVPEDEPMSTFGAMFNAAWSKRKNASK